MGITSLFGLYRKSGQIFDVPAKGAVSVIHQFPALVVNAPVLFHPHDFYISGAK